MQSLTVFSGLTFDAERLPMPDLTIFGGITFDAEREPAAKVKLFPEPGFQVFVNKTTQQAKFVITLPAHKASEVIRPDRIYAPLFLPGATIPTDGQEALTASVVVNSVEVPPVAADAPDDQPELALEVIVPIAGLFGPGQLIVSGVQMVSVISHPNGL